MKKVLLSLALCMVFAKVLTASASGMSAVLQLCHDRSRRRRIFAAWACCVPEGHLQISAQGACESQITCASCTRAIDEGCGWCFATQLCQNVTSGSADCEVVACLLAVSL